MNSERTELNEVLAKYRGRGRDALLPLLWDVQTKYGYISEDVVHSISHTLRVPEADIYGVIEFYTLFHSQPTEDIIVRICTDIACRLAGSDVLFDSLHHDETSLNGKCTLEHSACLGLCEHAPAALVSKRGEGEFSHAPVRDSSKLINGVKIDRTSTYIKAKPSILMDGVSEYQRENLIDYSALKQALNEHSPEAIITDIDNSGLIGRGGAAFPTGFKWKSARNAPDETRYVVCNADESEPGTFKDRVLMETRPHLLLEGMALCAYAIGSEKGYLFIRGEYPEATQILTDAIQEAESAGYLGDNIMGSDFSFHIEIRRGGGAYICGEETALFEAIEGKRGFPRVKPPYPTTHGLFGKPTVINNVETLCTVPYIIENGADWFKSIGTEKSTGSKLVSVSGHIKQAGVFEISPGITLSTLLEDFCGGIEGNLQAVLMGGAAGTFLKPDELDVRLTFEDLRAIGGTFGSGAIVIYNETVDLRDVLKQLATFFQHESCGKCFPCQLGTQRQLEILSGDYQSGDQQRLYDIGWTMTEASLCGLGQTAASAVLSAMQKFPHLFE